jgi:hypothetical protein
MSACVGAHRGVQPPAGGGSAPEIFFFRADIFQADGPTRMTYYQDDIFPGPHDIRWFSAHGFLPMVF